MKATSAFRGGMKMDSKEGQRKVPPGRITALAEHYASVSGTGDTLGEPRLGIAMFCADHGVMRPEQSALTPMIDIASGAAEVSVMARYRGILLTIIDVGVKGAAEVQLQHEGSISFRRKSLGPGTCSIFDGPAMSGDMLELAISIGRQQARHFAKKGITLSGLGEARPVEPCVPAVLASAITGMPVERYLDMQTDTHFDELCSITRRTHRRLRLHGTQPVRRALAEAGGFDIGAMVGFIAEARQLGMFVVVEGNSPMIAALCAERMWKRCSGHVAVASLSGEVLSAALAGALGQGAIVGSSFRRSQGVDLVNAMAFTYDAVMVERAMGGLGTRSRRSIADILESG